MGSCMSGMKGSNSKEMKRTGTNRSDKGGNDLQRTTSSYHGSVSDAVRYSDRTAADDRTKTASELHKSQTLEERLKKANKANDRARS